MSRRKRRFSLFDDIFEEFFGDLGDIFNGMGGGYSISVYSTPEGTIVEANVDESVDVEEFRKQLEERYPGAKIIIRGGKQPSKIERVDQNEEEKKVTITLVENNDQSENKEKEIVSREPSILDMIHGKKRVFIEREK